MNCMKQQISKIKNDLTWTWLWRGYLKGKTKSFLIAAQNNAIRTNYIEEKWMTCNKIASIDYVLNSRQILRSCERTEKAVKRESDRYQF